MMEEPDTGSEKEKEVVQKQGQPQPPGRIDTASLYATEGISTLRLDVTVDDDAARAARRNEAAEAVEGMRRVAVATEFEQANRVHLAAMGVWV
jgi:hypothetical protein